MHSSLLKCANCDGQFTAAETFWRCQKCGKEVPATLGIPNFMPGAPAPSEEALRLAEAYASKDFEGLCALHQPQGAPSDGPIAERYASYRRQMADRGRDFYNMVRERLEELYEEPRTGRGGVALVAGCGVGACFAPVVDGFDQVVGLDPGLEELILAKRAIEDIGASNVTLVQGIAQQMPLRDKCVDFVIAQDVIEHLIDLDRAFSELGRVIADGGVFAGNSVNRYNLLRPEPHVKLWFIGLLPRPLQKRYARWRRGVVGYDDWVRPPSYYRLRDAMRHGLGPQSRVAFPKVAAFGFPPAIDRVLKWIERVNPLAVALLWIFPSHLAIGRRTRTGAVRDSS